MPPPIPNLPAEHINVRFHAEGGMSRVYIADHVALQRREAIKLLHPQATAEERQLFMREGRILAKLNHDFICQVFDVKDSADGPYLRMEFIEGPTLRESMQERRLSVSAAIDITLKLASALSLAHSKGVVHSDLKPENVLLEKATQRPKLIDFGIARRIEGHGHASTLSGSGKVRGTPQYISPEQLRGEPASPASDLYSLGIMLFEMLAGEPPFKGDRETLIHAHLYESPPRLPKDLADLQPLMDRLLAKQVEARFADCDTFDAALVALLEDSDTLRIHLPPDRLARASRARKLAQSQRNKKEGRSTQYFTTSMGAPTRPPEPGVPPVRASADGDGMSVARQLLAKLATGTATAAQRFQFIANLLTEIERAGTLATLESIAKLMDESERLLGERIDLSVAREALEQHDADLRSRQRREQANEALARSQRAASKGIWLPPDEDNAVVQAKDAAALDPENFFAQDWLAKLPATIAQAISHLNRDNHFDQALALATGALPHFPDNPDLQAQLRLVSAAIAREARRREHDAAMFTLAARLPQDPEGNALQAAQRLLETDPADANRPGARSLARELRNWLERLADGSNADSLAGARLLLEAHWQQLRAAPSLQPTISRVETVLAELESRRRRELRSKELAHSLNAAIANGRIFDTGEHGLLTILATAFGEGFRSETERFLTKRAPVFIEAVTEAVTRNDPQAPDLDAWMQGAAKLLGDHAILLGMRRACEGVRLQMEVQRGLEILTARVASNGSVGAGDFAATLGRLAARSDGEIQGVTRAIGDLIESISAAASGHSASNNLDELDGLLDLLTMGAAARGLADRAAEARALVATARRRRQQATRIAALDAAIEAFLSAPDIRALERIASASRGLDERPASLDAVTGWLSGHLLELGTEGEWARSIDWLSRARTLFPPHLHAQVDRDMEDARLALERSKQIAALKAALVPGRILARGDASLLATLRIAHGAGLADSISTLLQEGYEVIEKELLSKIDDANDGDTSAAEADRWIKDLETVEAAAGVASRLRGAMDTALRLRPSPIETTSTGEVPAFTEHFVPAPASPFDAFCTAPSSATARALCFSEAGLAPSERQRASELIAWFLEQLLHAEAFDEFDDLLRVAYKLLGPEQLRSLADTRGYLAAEVPVPEDSTAPGTSAKEPAVDLIPGTSPIRTEAYRFEPPDSFGSTESIESSDGFAGAASSYPGNIVADGGIAPPRDHVVREPAPGDVERDPRSHPQPREHRSEPSPDKYVGRSALRTIRQRRLLAAVSIASIAAAAIAFLLVPAPKTPEKSSPVVAPSQPAPEPPQPLPAPPQPPPPPARQVGEVFSDALTAGGRGPEMVVVREGLAAGIGEITVREFRKYASTLPAAEARRWGDCLAWDEATEGWARSPARSWADIGRPQSEMHPVVCVSWSDAVAYTKWLSDQTGEVYRLPTFLEWYEALWGQYGLGTDVCTWANLADQTLSETGRQWGVHADCRDGHWGSAPSRSFLPHRNGVHDLIGNVWEWLADCANQQDAGQPDGACAKRRVVGGSWIDAPEKVTTNLSFAYPAETRSDSVGMRVVRETN